jgi:hypothetical protein
MWKYSIVSYGQRWIVIETIFSSIKRMFDGEYVYSAVRLKNMIQEMMLKASLYNKMIIYLFR